MSADLVQFLPQTGPARLIVEVIESGAERSVCVAKVPARSPFRSIGADRRCVAASLAVEMAAQAAAVAEPSDASANASASAVSPAAGPRLLAGARDVTLHARTLNADSSFRIVTTRTTHAPPLRIYRFQVFDANELVAEGELSTFFDAR